MNAMSSRKRKTKPARLSAQDISDGETDNNANGSHQPMSADHSLNDAGCVSSRRSRITSTPGSAMGSRDAHTIDDHHLATDQTRSKTCENEFAVDWRAETVTGNQRMSSSSASDDVMETVHTVLSSADTVEDKHRRLNVMIRQLETIKANLACRGREQQPHRVEDYGREVRFLFTTNRCCCCCVHLHYVIIGSTII